MINYSQLITKKWYHFRYIIPDTNVIVDVKAEDSKAADKIMHDNYPDLKFVRGKVSGLKVCKR